MVIKKTDKTTGRKKVTGNSKNRVKYPYRRSPWRELYKGVGMPGKPPKYTKEYLDKLADKMYSWVLSHPDALFLRPFFSEIKMHYTVVYDILHVSDKFRETFRYCQQICADRLHESALKNKINGVYATRFMHFFDGQLNKSDQENEKKKTKHQLDAAKEAQDQDGKIEVTLKIEKE